MQQLARTNEAAETTAAQLSSAEVTAADDGRLTLREPGLRYEARRAASCLLEPAPGDTVLATHTADGQAYVLAVLTRPEGAPSTLRLDSDAQLCAPGGRLEIAARDGVDLRTPGTLSMAAAALDMTAATGKVAVRSLTVAGETARAGWDRVKLVARQSESVADQVVQQMKTRLCRVASLDLLRAKNLQQKVDDLYALGTGHALIRARKQVKLDGEQIIVG